MVDIENLEEEYAKLVEEKQIELIWHPERREEYKISFSVGNVVRSFCFYRNDPPMSVFHECTYFYLYMYLVEMKSDWKKYAIKAVLCLRQMPVAIRQTHLCWYHKRIMEAYGSGRKAEIHRKQYILYASEEATLSLDEVMGECKQSTDMYLAFCIEILSYIVKCTDILGKDDFYAWTRDQYELVEKILKEAINLYGELNRCPIPLRSCLYYFQGIYYKKTRRYTLAERSLQKSFHLLSNIEVLAVKNIRIARNRIEDLLKIIQHLDNKEVEANKIDEIHQLLTIGLSPLEQTFIDCIEAFFHNYSIDIDKENECEDNETVIRESEKDRYAFDELYDMAEEGDANAQTAVAVCYMSGDGVVQNFRLAFEWMQIAARQGQGQAQYLVGGMYHEGLGTEQDQEKAFEWCMKAAMLGNAEAQNYIGWVYDVGLGVESDYTEVFKWFVMAAEQGLAMAQANVGEYYEFGKGVPKDLEQAVVWYQKAAELKCEEAVGALKRLGR